MNAWLDPAWLRSEAEALAARSLEVWLSGGWTMLAIALTAVVMFTVGCNTYLRLQVKGFQSLREKTWRRWVEDPAARRGLVGRFIDRAARRRSVQEMGIYFKELRQAEIAPFYRDLRVMRICVGAAPLLGLLGTVIGMLDTFGALASGSGGDETMGMIAGGISQAPVTTETGLIIAIPGLFFHAQLQRKHQRYRAFLSHLESACAQALYKGRLCPGREA